MAVTWKALAFAESLDAKIDKTTLDAQSILYAITDNVPAALVIAANKFPARASTGDLEAKTITDFALSILDDTNAAGVLSTLGITLTDYIPKSIVDTAGDLIVATAADTVSKLAIDPTAGKVLTVVGGVPAWAAPASVAPLAHATTHKSGGSDAIKLNEFAVPTGAVDFNKQQATNLVLHTVADNAAKSALTTPVVGTIVWQTDNLTPYICTASS